MHNKDAIAARASRSLWHQSITALRQGTAPLGSTASKSGLHDAVSSVIDARFDSSDEERDRAALTVSKICQGDTRDDLRQSLNAVATFSAVLRRMDAQTHNHSERVARNTLRLARRVGVANEDFYALQLGALLHDCGKIGVSAQILNKPGALTAEEFSEVKKHPLHGVAILDSVPLLRLAVPIVRHHHERFDGRGYPDGLQGENIPLTARIVGLVDAFDAIISDRPYRRGVSAKEARGILCENGGSQFDPELVEAFVSDNSISV